MENVKSLDLGVVIEHRYILFRALYSLLLVIFQPYNVASSCHFYPSCILDPRIDHGDYMAPWSHEIDMEHNILIK